MYIYSFVPGLRKMARSADREMSDMLKAFEKLRTSTPGGETEKPLFYTMFEKGTDNEMVKFVDYKGPMSSNHQKFRQWVPINPGNIDKRDNFDEFDFNFREVINFIGEEGFPIGILMRFGITYFNGRLFKFDQSCSAADFCDAVNSPKRGERSCYRQPSFKERQFPAFLKYGDGYGCIKPSFFPDKGCNNSDEFIADLKEMGYIRAEEFTVVKLHFKTTSGIHRIIKLSVDDGNMSIQEISMDERRFCSFNILRDKSKSKFSSPQSYDDIYDIRVQLKTAQRKLVLSETSQIYNEEPVYKDFIEGKIKVEAVINRDENGDYKVSEDFAKCITFLREEKTTVFRKGGDQIEIHLEKYRQLKCDPATGVCTTEMTVENALDARFELMSPPSDNELEQNIAKIWSLTRDLADIATKASATGGGRGYNHIEQGYRPSSGRSRGRGSYGARGYRNYGGRDGDHGF